MEADTGVSAVAVAAVVLSGVLVEVRGVVGLLARSVSVAAGDNISGDESSGGVGARFTSVAEESALLLCRALSMAVSECAAHIRSSVTCDVLRGGASDSSSSHAVSLFRPAEATEDAGADDTRVEWREERGESEGGNPVNEVPHPLLS